ncbi:MAG: WD40 repeat domain-containing protein, partial [Cytophagales bacterium]
MSTQPISVQKKAVYSGHRDCIYAVEKGSDASLFFSSSGDGMVVKWQINDPEAGELIAKMPNSVYALKYVEGKKQLLVGQNFEGLHLIDLETKKEIRSLKITDSYIYDIQVFNNQIFVACGNGEIIIIDGELFQKIHTIKASAKSARCMAINALVNEFAVGFSDFNIRTYSLADFSLQKEWTAHTNSIFSLQFTPDNKHLVS